jgi:hypothetical protein
MPREYESMLELARQTLGRMAKTEALYQAREILDSLPMI